VLTEVPTAGTQTRVIGVAVPIPQPWGGELQRWRDRFGDPLADAIPTHVTLLPPTSIDASLLPEIETHLADAAQRSRAFDMHLRGTGTFRPVSAVVFVDIAVGTAACEDVERLVRTGPLARPLDFPYHPHVTVAHELPEDVLDEAFAALATYEASFTVPGFSLYEHLDGVWQARRTFTFGAQPEPSGG
jgi:2'-5' RNA ligase